MDWRTGKNKEPNSIAAKKKGLLSDFRVTTGEKNSRMLS